MSRRPTFALLVAALLCKLALHGSAQEDDGSIVLEGDAGSIIFGSGSETVALTRSSLAGLDVSGALNVQSALTVEGLPVALKVNTTATQTQVDDHETRITASEADITTVQARLRVARSVRIYGRLDITDYDTFNANEYASFPVSLECFVENDAPNFAAITSGGPHAQCAGNEVRGEVDFSCSQFSPGSSIVSISITVRTYYGGGACDTTTVVATQSSNAILSGDGHSMPADVVAAFDGDEAALRNIHVFNTMA